MLFDYIRVLTSIGTLGDKSLQNQDDSSTVALNLSTIEYLYVAQKVPFNNMFFHMDTVNTEAATLSVEYWDGIAWREAVDILDGTYTGGATLGKSGNLQFSLDSKYGWQRISDTSENYAPTELQTLHIYECYWVRIKPSANLLAGTKVKEIGYAFTASQELPHYDIEVNTYLESFATGKTDWIPEILSSSKALVLDLRQRGLIVHPGQIIQMDDVHVACSYKTLEKIYFQLGPNYADKMKEVQSQYLKAINLTRFTFDTGKDGKIDLGEQTNVVRKLTR